MIEILAISITLLQTNVKNVQINAMSVLETPMLVQVALLNIILLGLIVLDNVLRVLSQLLMLEHVFLVLKIVKLVHLTVTAKFVRDLPLSSMELA